MNLIIYFILYSLNYLIDYSFTLIINNQTFNNFRLKAKSAHTELNLLFDDIGDEGAKSIADSLKVNKTITNLNLSDNRIGYESSKVLAYSLKINKDGMQIAQTQWYVGYKDHDAYRVVYDGIEQKKYYKERDFVRNAANGELEKCQLSLDEGIDINANLDYRTALGVAARNGHTKLCEYLLSQRAQVDICKLLLQHGANVKAVTNTGRTIKSYIKNAETLQLLEEYGLQKTINEENISADLLHSVTTDNDDIPAVGESDNQDSAGSILNWCTIL
jgi:hypothetical protein